MIIAIDFDGVIVDESQAYDDLATPLTFLPGARAGLRALKRAGHVLVLWSSRSSPANVYPWFNPLVRAGIRADASSEATRKLHADRLRQMLAFVAVELPGVFDAVDDGMAGKIHADAYIDNHGVRFGDGMGWPEIAALWGE